MDSEYANKLFLKIKSKARLNPKPLISTLFGDLVVPNGGCIWVETIIALLEPLGISERLVRTSLFRMVEEGWLKSTRVGRKSYYELTEFAQSQTRIAEQIIYSPNQHEWDGKWTLVFIVIEPVNHKKRRQLEQELTWLGFGAVTKHIMAHPTVSAKSVAQRVKQLGLERKVVCLRATNPSQKIDGLEVSSREMAEKCFPLSVLETQYQDFVSLSHCLREFCEVSNKKGLIAARLILIDEFRHIVLCDAHLPDALLPSPWIGDKAYEICKEIYQMLRKGTEDEYRSILNDIDAKKLLSDIRLGYSQQRFSASLKAA